MDVPEVRYARSGDAHIAYQVMGAGPVDLVVVLGFISHLEHWWEDLGWAALWQRLSSFCRLILFDKRGTGLSDRVAESALPTLEQRMDDLRAVLDAVGSRRTALLSISEGGPMCILFAATYPDRTSALLLYGSFGRFLWAPDQPWNRTPEDLMASYTARPSRRSGPLGGAQGWGVRAAATRAKPWLHTATPRRAPAT